jgi:glycosyltransferase involved in cell wall biosynthesis
MVCLSPKNKTPVIPGKILGYMAADLPVAAFLHKSSDGHEVIENSGCGLSSDSADEESCIQIMSTLLDNPDISSMGMAGRSYAEKHFSKEVCMNQLERLLN